MMRADAFRVIDGTPHAVEFAGTADELVSELAPPQYKYALYTNSFAAASAYALERSWWIHSWRWVTDDFATEEVVEYVLPETPSLPFDVGIQETPIDDAQWRVE